MKRATGELNATLVVVTLVGLMAAFFFFVLWPEVKNIFVKDAKCSDAMCDRSTIDSNGMVDCVYKDDDGIKHDLKCVWKG